MNDIRKSNTLTAHGVARVLVFAARELFDDENAQKTLRQLADWLQEANMPLSMHEKPNAANWCDGIAYQLDDIISSDQGVERS